MKKGTMTRIHFVLIVLLVFSTLTAPAWADGSVSSTFIQIDSGKASLSVSDWKKMFASFRALGIGEIVLQWTATNKAPYFKPYQRVKMPLAPAEFLDIAHQNHLGVKIGLLHDPEFWVRIEERPSSLNVYFTRVTEDSLRLAEELFPEIASHPAFAGWYLPQEIDDVNWKDRKKRKVLCHFMKDITSRLKIIAPRASISISTFSNGKLSPGGFASMWDELLSSSRLDTVYFQDGIGTKKLDFYSVPIYFKSLKVVTEKHGVSFIPIVEFFEIPEPGGSEKGFGAGSTNRIKKQLKIASAYSSKISCFGLTECLILKSPRCRSLLRILKTWQNR